MLLHSYKSRVNTPKFTSWLTRSWTLANSFRYLSATSVGGTEREPERARFFRVLNLKTFSESEIVAAHTILKEAHQRLYESANDQSARHTDRELCRIAQDLKLVQHGLPTDLIFPPNNAPDVLDTSKTLLQPKNMQQVLPVSDFSARIRKVGEELDNRVWPVAISFAATGLSIGIIIPILPILVKEINLPPSTFGIAVSAFGLAKVLGNVPSALWVEKYGRKPVMVGGMAVCAAGLGSIGFSLFLGAPWLIGCRFVTGLGVAAFTSGAFMYMSDISTALNRTRTMAPVMSAFQAGAAVGPAIGGVAVESLGILNSYITVGSSIAFLAVLNKVYLAESMPPAIEGNTPIHGAKPSIRSSFQTARQEWKELMKNKAIRDVVILNGIYWAALAGTQLTLLPVFMVSAPLSLNAEHIGIIFSGISIISVVSAQPCASLADNFGKVPCMLLGASLLSLSFGSIPMTTTFETLVAACAPLALGSTVLSAVPTAHVSDLTTPGQRAQALALLRTAADMGLLTGAVSAGLVSEYIGMGSTMQGNAAMLGAAVVWYGIRNYTNISTNPSATSSNGVAGEQKKL